MLALVAVLVAAPRPAIGQENGDARDRSASRSGYDDLPEWGGPASVPKQLEEDDSVKQTVFRFQALKRGLKPYFDFKRRLKKKQGFSFGIDYTSLYLSASNSLGDNDAASGMIRFFGNWELTGRGSDNVGSLVYKIENRHRYGGGSAPNAIASEIGYPGVIAGPYSNQQWRVTNLYWSQRSRNGRLNLVAGWLDATDYLDVYALANPWTAFLNLAFSTGSSSIPIPNEGLGIAAGGMLTESMYIVGGLADSNADPHDPGDGFSTFFNDNEFFTHVEIGWTNDFDRRYFDNTHITIWHADAREEVGVPDGWGWNFSWSRFVDDTWMPFVRAGYADDGGSLLEGSLTVGVGYYAARRSDLFGAALNWGEPNQSTFSPGLDDQLSTEIFYRLQLSENFAVTPNVQYIIDPALNPNEDSIYILGIRARLAL